MNRQNADQKSLLPDSFESLLALRFVSVWEINRHIDNGVTKREIMKLKDVLAISIVDISEILNITDRILYLKKDEDKLKRSIADRAFALAYLYSYLYNTFSDKKKADKWMNSKSKLLGDVTPLELCTTFVGANAVRKEIKRLAGGVY